MSEGSTDPRRQLEQLVANVEAMAQMFSMDKDEGEATDPTGTVTAVVGRDNRIRSLSVLPKWQQNLEDAELADAVKGAVGRAVCDVYGIEPSEPSQTADPDEESTFVDSDVTTEHRARAQQMVDDDLRKFEQAVHRDKGEMIAELRALADTAEGIAADWQASADQADAPGTELFSDNRRVSMTFASGGIMTEVTIDQNWVSGKSGNVITENLQQILEQADEISSGADIDAIMDQARQMSGGQNHG